MFYFAYGSNMSSRRLLARVPSASKIGVGCLRGFEMTFRKHSHDGSAKCTLEQKLKATTLGVVFKIPAEQRYTLDRIEGAGFGYQIKDVAVLLQSGQEVPAFTYLGSDLTNQLKPYDWYKHHVVTGAKEHGITCQYIDRILAIEAIPDPDPGRHQHEMSIYE